MPAKKPTTPTLIRATLAHIPSFSKEATNAKKPSNAKNSTNAKPRTGRILLRWTDEDIKFLRRHYGTKGAVFCAKELGRTKSSVNHRAELIGLRSKRLRAWTPKEDATLRLRYPKVTATRLAEIMNRSEQSVRHRLRKLGLTEAESLPWTDAEILYLRQHYGTLKSAELAVELGRTIDAVELKAGRLGLSRRITLLTPEQSKYVATQLGKKEYTALARELRVPIHAIERAAKENNYRARPTSREWTKADDEQLHKLFPLMTNKEIAERLDRTLLAVTIRARSLGMFRAPEKRKKRAM